MEPILLASIRNINQSMIELLKIIEMPNHGDISTIKQQYFILRAVENSLWAKLRELESKA